MRQSSKGCDWQLGHDLDILRRHRPPTTPVGCVRDASRPGERAWITTPSEFDCEMDAGRSGCGAT